MSERRVSVPPDADPDEAAAIVAAVQAHLAAEREDADGTGVPDEPWPGRRWTFTGRIQATQSRTVRVPEDAPADAWTAAGRTDRY
ncbi:MAG: acc operon protein [Halobacteriaceae archaeon]